MAGRLLAPLSILLLLAFFASSSEPADGSCSGSEGASCVVEDASLIQRPQRSSSHRPLAPVLRKVLQKLGPILNASHPDYIRLPHGGWAHKDCIIDVPSGTKREKHPDKEGYHVLRLPNGTNFTLAPCKYPSSGLQHLRRFVQKRLALSEGNSTENADLGNNCNIGGGQASSGPLAMYGTNTAGPMKQFNAVAYVPGTPTNAAPNSWLYWWIGAMPADYSVVLQPVLMYNEAIGWSMANWDCCPGGNQIKSDIVGPLQVNEELPMHIKQTGSDSYEVSICRAGNQGCSVLQTTNTGEIVTPLVQFETYNVANAVSCGASTCTDIHCDYLPTSSIAMNGLQVSPGTKWQPHSSRCWGLDTHCGWDIQTYIEGYTEPAIWANPP